MTLPANWADKLIVFLILVFTGSRFVGLEISPPGFFSDEAGAAFSMLCPGEGGHKLLFPIANADGHYSAPFIYLGAVWMEVFGSSIGSYRTFGATFNALAILSVFLFMRRLCGLQVALLSALAAAASPWGFQFARFVTDNSLAPFFLVMGLLLMLPDEVESGNGPRASAWRWPLRVSLAALCLAVAMYIYPPQRLIVPLVALAFAVCLPRAREKNSWPVFCAVFFCLLAPLVYVTVFGDAQRRFNALAIWRPGDPVLPAIQLFLENFAAHFQPGYLFTTGDKNLRHSSQSVGLLSPLDVIGLIGILLFVIRQGPSRLVLFLILGIAISLLPGALTNHAIPHSLRTFSGWLFVSMLAGLGLAKVVEARRFLVGPILAVAAASFGYFSYHYYANYPGISGDMIHGFEVEMKDAAAAARASGDWVGFARQYKDYRPDAARYYLMSMGGMGCSQSAAVMAEAGESR
jgi:4-amino-4-deoxy-L-arabinose transferase-like glycosyltransferase